MTELLLPLILATLMFGMGLALTPASFAALGEHPRLMAAGLISLSIGLPLLAVFIGWLTGSSPDLRLALLVIGACPAGSLSAVLAGYARADVALSLSFTVATSLLSVVVTPAVLSLLAPLTGVAEGMAYPTLPFGPTLVRVALVIALPIALGVALRHRFGARVDPIHYLIKAVGGVTILALFAWLMIGQADVLLGSLHASFGPIAAYNGAAGLVGLALGRFAAGPAPAGSITVAHQVRQEETGLFLALNVLGMPALAVPLLVNATIGFWLAVLFVTVSRSRLRPFLAPSEEARS